MANKTVKQRPNAKRMLFRYHPPLAATSAKPWVAKTTEGRADHNFYNLSKHQVVARREAWRAESRATPYPRKNNKVGDNINS